MLDDLHNRRSFQCPSFVTISNFFIIDERGHVNKACLVTEKPESGKSSVSSVNAL